MLKASKVQRSKYATRGPKFGACNICGSMGALSEDHVPPKGCPRVSGMRMHQLIEVLGAGRVPPHGRQAQGGVKYRSICARCNNRLLGTEYDPELIRLAVEIDRFLSALRVGVVVPSHTQVRVRSQRLARAVAGHVLAAAIQRPATGAFDQPLANYFLDPKLPFPSDLSLSYWLYPFRQQVVVRDGVIISTRISESKATPTYFMLLNFYPLAFLLTTKGSNSYRFNLLSLDNLAQLGIDDDTDLNVAFKGFPNEWGPEAPSDEHVPVFAGQTLYATRPRAHH